MKGDIIKSYCVDCKRETSHKIIEQYQKTLHEKKYDVSIYYTYQIIDCLGCNNISFQEISSCSENTTYDDDMQSYVMEEHKINYPLVPSHHRPAWSNSYWTNDTRLRELLNEVYDAIDNQLNTLAAIGIRTTIEASCVKLSIPPKNNFCKKTKELFREGHVGKQEALNIYKYLMNAGNAATHENWKPSNIELNILITYLEGFLYRVFIAPKELEKLSIPEKPKKVKSNPPSKTTQT